MSRPSATQRAVIRWFDGGPVPAGRAGQQTYEACERRGWIEPTEEHPYYRTTEAGRAALGEVEPMTVYDASGAAAARAERAGSVTEGLRRQMAATIRRAPSPTAQKRAAAGKRAAAERRRRAAALLAAKMADEELLGYADISALTGVSAATLRSYRVAGRLPEPEPGGVPDRPRWKAATIADWMMNRPGRGAPGQPRAKRTAAD